MDTQDIIAIQDLEYQESLENDIKKEQDRKKELEERKRIEDNIASKREKLSVNRGGNIINLKFQIPSGSVTRVFTSNDTMEDLYDFIYIQDIGENFQIFSNVPKKLLKNDKTTLNENNIANMTKLYVYLEN